MNASNAAARLAGVLLALVGTGVPFTAAAQPTVLQPDAAAGQDAALYEGFPGNNLSGGTATPPFSTFTSYLVVSQTSSGHDLHSVVKFDLSSLADVSAHDVTSATFSLYAVDSASLGFRTASPSAATPIDVSVYTTPDTWSQTSVTWGNKPYSVEGDNQPVGTPQDSQRVAAVDAWVDFDVTAALRAALTAQQGALSLALASPAAVAGAGGEVSLVALASESSTSSLAAGLQPRITLQYVPQPSAWLMLGAGLAALLVRTNRLA